MRLRSIGFIFFLAVLLACGKDKFQTKPSLEVKSVNTNDVQVGQPLVVTLEYTDKEGDLAGARIGVAKIALNCSTSNFIDSLKYTISGDVPSTNNQKGQIDVTFPYIFINPFCDFPVDPTIFRGDSAIFKFWLTDKGGNQSDTATTDLILIRKG